MPFASRVFLRIYNVFSNVIIVIFLYKIGKQLSKEYKVNVVLLVLLSMTFLTLPLLSTFVYGDIPSLAFSLISIYFIMRYTETNKLKFLIFSAFSISFAYMLRMNTLIFIIAILMYLGLNLFKTLFKNNWKKNLLEVGIIVLYIIIAFLPSNIIKNYYINKYDIDKDKSYPIQSFLLFSMMEGPRSNGWYNEDIAEPALQNLDKIDEIKKDYTEKIKERIVYFLENPKYTFEFYTKKITSMWAENTYSAIRNNFLESELFENVIKNLTFYQKTLLVLCSASSIIVLIKNRKNLSLNLILLITIFIGGFMFHILWEAKSRYIIPYVLILIPISSIEIKNKINSK